MAENEHRRKLNEAHKL